ncbi:uncharacterized protein LOC142238163 [Haematobia irritans]|uniref:uncharacterized protein LOC142238163 n=1 Tax=Haematobia irritans TaxID=7368 RepID=UPI003F507353
MLKSIVAKNLRKSLTPFNSRSYAKGCGSGGGCTKPKGCNMYFKDRKNKAFDCLPKEPDCTKAKSPSKPNFPTKNPDIMCCDNERLKRDPCYERRELCEKKDLKLDRHVLPLKSVWEYPAECCGNPCPELLPRFDTLYYCATDKEKREYQQTWVECPPLQIRKRKICCYDREELPPLCKRPKAECNRTACPLDAGKLKALCCLDQMNKCPRFKLPCCRTARSPPSCKNPPSPSDCKKRCCPYPSFSECCRPCPKPKRPTECLCLATRTKCEMYAELRRKLKYGLPPPVPAWPPKMLGPRY